MNGYGSGGDDYPPEQNDIYQPEQGQLYQPGCQSPPGYPEGMIEPDEYGADEIEPAGDQKVKWIAGGLFGLLGLVIGGIFIVLLGSQEPAVPANASPSAGASPLALASESPSLEPIPSLYPEATLPAGPSTPAASPAPSVSAEPSPSASPSPSAPPTATPVPVPGDEMADAIAVDGLPFRHKVDIAGATRSRSDPDCDAVGPSIWFAYRPNKDLTVGGTTSDSNFYTSIALGRRTNSGGFELISCYGDSLRFDARSGVTYLFAVSSYGDDEDDYGHGGSRLVFRLGEAAAQPQIKLSVDPQGTFDTQGHAHISGMVSCSGAPDNVSISVSLSQRYDRFVFQGWGDTWMARCTSKSRSWSVIVEPYNGTFGEGTAQLSIDSWACDAYGCGNAELQASVSLTTANPTPSPPPATPSAPPATPSAPPSEAPAAPPEGDSIDAGSQP